MTEVTHNNDELTKSLNGSEVAKSPSISSISSGASSSSTENLIQTLGKDSKTPIAKTSEILPKSPLSPTSLNSNGGSKKPIKFTVRKVSHEPIQSPKLGAGSQGKVRDEEAKDQNNLKHAQTKYDHYVSKINKIEKEIDFLTKLLPPYNVEIDYTTRTKITKAIEKLRMKQDEIEKKKYSLGITISRLWRAHDDSDIWVRTCSKQ